MLLLKIDNTWGGGVNQYSTNFYQLKKEKEYANLFHFLLLATEPPLVQQPPAPPKRRSHRNLTLHMPEEEENDVDMDAPMSAFLKRSQKNKKKK